MTAAACLLLAVLAPALLQERPQRVEAMTEIRWCEEQGRFVLRQYTYKRIQGYATRFDEVFVDLRDIERPALVPDVNGP